MVHTNPAGMSPNWRPIKTMPKKSRRIGVVAAVALLAVFSLTACQPTPAQTALKLTVSDTASIAVANLTVSVFPAADTSAPATANGITDANGDVWFTHDQLPGGDYVVRYGAGPSTSWYPDVASRASATTVTTSDVDTIRITGSLDVTPGYIVGQVDDSAGAGVPAVKVTAYDAVTGEVVGTRATYIHGAIGAYALYPGDMHPGSLYRGQTYKIGFTKAGFATVYAGAGGTVAYSLADAAAITAGKPNGVHVDLVLQPESTITGTVKPDGTNPMGGVIVGALVADTNHFATTTTTAADGTFTLHGLSGIGYKLAFIAPSGANRVMVLGAGTGPGASFDLANGSTFSLQPGGNLSVGTVTLTVGADCATAQAGTSAGLPNADLHNCDLQTADLSSVDLSGANLSGANLAHATLPNYFLAAYPSMGGATLVAANLSRAQVPSPGTTVSGGADLSAADLSAADLSHANLRYGSLSGSSLVGANLSHTDLSYGSIAGSNISGADLSSPTFQDTNTYDLTWSALPTIPSGYKLVDSNLIGARVLLSSVNLSGADLSGMDLSGIHLSSVNLTGADLSHTTLTGITWNVVDLSGADMTGAELTVNYSAHLASDANTILPAGWSIVNGSFQQT